tara:strand:- start:1475 stop:2440 length:966 start_codon:yes stop_codon:yes gene_type:complete
MFEIKLIILMKNLLQRNLPLLLLLLQSCSNDYSSKSYETNNVVILVMDGARFTETWGDSTHQYIPRLANRVFNSGNVYTKFYNQGPTYTNSGHSAITTGNYQKIDNTGSELPLEPSIFQYFLRQSKKDSSKAFVVASKDKLEILTNCSDTVWRNSFTPMSNCGINGLGSGYRNDSITFEKAKEIFTTHHPKLVLINFREPDYSGHTNNWDDYINGIKKVDEYVYKLIEYVENDETYKNKTTYFVTNDHGRHLDDISTGFSEHGDGCEGCRHINLFAFGPDFKSGAIFERERELIDVSATTAELLGFEIPTGKGQIMVELFE